MADLALRANRPGARSRKPKTYAGDRICAFDTCQTVVSRYNRSDHCFAHRPVKYPRLRGVFSDEWADDAAGR